MLLGGVAEYVRGDIPSQIPTVRMHDNQSKGEAMVKTTFEVSQAKNELQDYLGPRYVVEMNLGVSGAGVVFVVRDRESGEIRVATLHRPSGQTDEPQSK